MRPPLISTQSLADEIEARRCVVFDCRHDLLDMERGARRYAAGHIVSACFASMERNLARAKTGSNGRHPLPSPNAFADFLAGCGVTENSLVVAYDDSGGQYAARLWWLTRWIGLRQVAVLDGGLPKWIAEGRAIVRDAPPMRGGALTATVDRSRGWTADEVRSHLGEPGFALIDARAPERYRGEAEPIDLVAGRIPGARNRFFRDNLNADGTMRPAAELKREFTALLAGVPPENAVHQCGSGVTACVNLLAMEHAGLEGSKLYAGSWSEWIADPLRPIARG